MKKKKKKTQEKVIDEQKLRYLASRVAIWDHFCIPQAHYLALDTNEKSKMLSQYYKELLVVYFGVLRTLNYFCLNSGFFLSFRFWIVACLWVVYVHFSRAAVAQFYNLFLEFLCF